MSQGYEHTSSSGAVAWARLPALVLPLEDAALNLRSRRPAGTNPTIRDTRGCISVVRFFFWACLLTGGKNEYFPSYRLLAKRPIG